MADSKKRSMVFATIAYPESFTFMFIKNNLESLNIPYVISPLHNRDVTETGELKKPHYHVMLFFDSLKSLNQVKDIIDDRFVGLEIVNSTRSYVRYLCHLDDVDKVKYNKNDIISKGLNLDKYFLEEYDKYDAFESVMDYVISTGTTNFADLLIYAKSNNKAMFRAVLDNSFTLREFLRSFAASNRRTSS